MSCPLLTEAGGSNHRERSLTERLLHLEDLDASRRTERPSLFGRCLPAEGNLLAAVELDDLFSGGLSGHEGVLLRDGEHFYCISART